jgi:hypothetical protein
MRFGGCYEERPVLASKLVLRLAQVKPRLQARREEL